MVHTVLAVHAVLAVFGVLITAIAS